MDEHKPVLVDEVLAALAVRPSGRYVDATFGRGGHSERILAALGRDGRLIAIDRDWQAIQAGQARFASEPRLTLVHGAYGEIAALLRAADPSGGLYDGILIDCGVSSPQLDNAARGFSFQKDGPLDMRMDAQRGEPVSAWLARATVEEMRDVIATLGQERFARRIAVAIERERAKQPLTRTLQLANLVSAAVPAREPGKHPATRTFQALRMHTNDELGQLRAALEQAVPLLAPGGRLAVISFHSLEDGVVRDFLRSRTSVDPALARLPVIPASALPPLKLVGRKQRAGAAEVHANPRARSALLRVAERAPSVAA
ncbi:MAG TPA: 16S rRNA (cytosine(1402)-N(4))-methyltransferase RsmH [Steroidobacteraceae bacterium]|nr:16S rRNA (cytosine(1402)-N(4))-methyltransferase RsmH [Steroidobacteraceae bacterium]